MIIDSHQHFWQLEQGYYSWLTPNLKPLYRDFLPKDLSSILKKCKIEKTIIIQAAECIEETEFMLELAKKNNFVCGVVGWLNMESSNFNAQLTKFKENSLFKGIRPMIQEIEDIDWMLKTSIEKSFISLINNNLTFDALVYPKHLNNLLKLLHKFPDLKVVIDHGGKPQIRNSEIESWTVQINKLAKKTKAYCKVSGLITEAKSDWREEIIIEYIDVLFKAFGIERLMWGSDWPVVNLSGNYIKWFDVIQNYTSKFNSEEKDLFYYKNASHFYDITDIHQ